MDACIPDRPTTQCHRCLRRRTPAALAPSESNRSLGLRAVVIDASTVLVEGRCLFLVDSTSLGQRAPAF